jgi:alpha-glucosidase
MLLLTLRGTPTLYYGDEIGMADVPIPPAEVQDPFEKNMPGLGLGRDPQRTPMPWSDAPQAGFTHGAPWLRLGADWPTRNVEAQERDPDSMLRLYERLIALRRREPALHQGRYEPLEGGHDVLAYARVDGTRRLVVLLNFGSTRSAIAPGLLHADGVVLASTHAASVAATAPALLEPFEGVVVGSLAG